MTAFVQGEVEQIALMKPKASNENDDGMLEYLEDIIGSSRLKVIVSQFLLLVLSTIVVTIFNMFVFSLLIEMKCFISGNFFF